MKRSPAFAALGGLLVLIAGAPTLRAQEAAGKTLLVPLEADDASRAGAAEKLSDVLTDLLHQRGAELIEARVSRDDLAAVAGCADDGDACLQSVAQEMGVAHVIMGKVAAQGDKLSVSLALHDLGVGTRRRTVVVAADDQDRFRLEATAFLDNKEPPPPKVVAPPPPAVVAPPVTGQPTNGGFALGRVKPYTWGIVGGGVVLAGIGAVLYTLAADKQDEIDRAPTDTLADLQRLESLESDGKNLATLGNAATVVGALAVGAGVTLAILQGRRAGERPRVSAAPTIGRGLGVVVTVGGSL